jgi:phenylacetate-CoA ligase
MCNPKASSRAGAADWINGLGENLKPIGEIILPWRRRLLADFLVAREYSAEIEQRIEEDTVARQLCNLQAVWEDCVADVPYYRRLAKSGQAPERISSWDDFRAIPALTRDILQQSHAEFRRISSPPDLNRMTGGSTGAPVRFGAWKSEDQILRRLKLVLWSRAGYTPQSRIFLIWGHAHLLGQGWVRHRNHVVRKAKDWIAGYQRVDAYSLSPDYCRQIAGKLIAFRPVGIIGYASALDYFVRTTEELHPQFRCLGIKFVMPSAEPPPKPDTFALLRNTFGARIIQEFGGVDFGQVAMKMDDAPFEVFSDCNILEAVSSETSTPDSGAAQVTTNYRRYLPLIRYRQGDEIRGCQRLNNGHVSRFEELAGRLNDMVKLPDGKSVHSVAFLHCVQQEPGIINAQLVLTDGGPFLRLVSQGNLSSECVQRIRHRFSQLSPELKNVRLEQVTDLETSIAGKRRWLVDHRQHREGA